MCPSVPLVLLILKLCFRHKHASPGCPPAAPAAADPQRLRLLCGRPWEVTGPLPAAPWFVPRGPPSLPIHVQTRHRVTPAGSFCSHAVVCPAAFRPQYLRLGGKPTVPRCLWTPVAPWVPVTSTPSVSAFRHCLVEGLRQQGRQRPPTSECRGPHLGP